MQENIKLSQGQVVFLICGSLLGSYAYNSLWIAGYVGKALWMVTLVSIIPIIPLVFWLMYMVRCEKKETIFDIIDAGLGKVVCKIILVLYYLITILLAVCILNLFVQLVQIFLLPNTPSWVIMLLFVFMCTMFANSGIKALGMFCQIIIGLGIINFYSGFGLFFVKEFKLENMTPMFDTTLVKFAEQVLFGAGSVCESLMLLMILTSVMSNSKKSTNWIIKGLLLWDVIYTVATMIYSGVIEPDMLKSLSGSAVGVAKLIEIGDFLKGMEIFVIAAFEIQAVVKVTIYLYCMHEASLKLFKGKNSKLHLGIAVVLIIIPSLLINSYNTAYFISACLYAYVLLPFSILVLLLASIAFFLSKRKRGVLVK